MWIVCVLFLKISFFKIFWGRTWLLFVSPLIPLYWTSGDISTGFQSQIGQPYSHWWRLSYYTFPEINLWCDTCQLLRSQHGSWAISSTHLWGIGGTQNQELSCHHSQCEIRQPSCSTDWAILAQPLLTVWDQAGQTLYRLSYPSLATTHSVRSGQTLYRLSYPSLAITHSVRLSWLSHCSQCEIRQARHSTDWAIPAWPPLTVWDQARHSTDWAIPAWPPLTVWDQAGQMLYRLSYPGSATISLYSRST